MSDKENGESKYVVLNLLERFEKREALSDDQIILLRQFGHVAVNEDGMPFITPAGYQSLEFKRKSGL